VPTIIALYAIDSFDLFPQNQWPFAWEGELRYDKTKVKEEIPTKASIVGESDSTEAERGSKDIL
jgi:hypothetical protein